MSINFLRKQLGWNIDFIYRIDKPDGILSPDLKRYINKTFEYWDIKTLGKSLNSKSKQNKIEHSISKHCFITIDFYMSTK